MANRNDVLLAFFVAGIAIQVFLVSILPAGATGEVGHLDPVQVQMLIDAYKDQLLFFKATSGSVILAETGAIVWLAKRLLAELSKKKR